MDTNEHSFLIEQTVSDGPQITESIEYSEMSGDEKRYLTIWKDTVRFFRIGDFPDTGKYLLQLTNKSGKPIGFRLIVPKHFLRDKAKKPIEKLPYEIETFFGMTFAKYSKLMKERFDAEMEDLNKLWDSAETFVSVFAGLVEHYDATSKKLPGEKVIVNIPEEKLRSSSPAIFFGIRRLGETKRFTFCNEFDTLKGRIKEFNRKAKNGTLFSFYEKVDSNGLKLSFENGVFTLTFNKK